MFVEVEHPLAGTVKVPNFPIKFSETPGEIRTAAPVLGADSKELLMGLLGMSEERFMELVRAGVTSQA
jgi:CoA:oxalate CoA-transferase